MTIPKLQCMIIDDDSVSRQIIEKYVEKTDNLNLVGSFSNAKEAQIEISKQELDLLFLDVEMPEVSGFELLDKLTEKPYIVMITAKADYALDAFEYDIIDFLLKPVSLQRFQKAVTKVQDSVNTTLNTPLIFQEVFVRQNLKYYRIAVQDILWIEAIGDYVEIYTHERKYVAHTTMKALEKKLASANFVRVHRSYIVRINNIEEIEENMLLINKKAIPIGKAFRDGLIRSLNIL